MEGGSKMISMIAKLPVKEDKVEEAIAAIKEFMVQVAKEEGTLSYTLNRDPKNPNTLVFMERYKDKAALDAHMASPHFQAFLAKGMPMLAGQPEMITMEEICSAR
jgi:quinol monooxygenase YgiN